MTPKKENDVVTSFKLSTMAACMDNRLSQGAVFRPMSKQELSATNRPKRLVEYSVNYGGFSYQAEVKQFEALSMDDELVLLVCLSMMAQFSRGKVLSPPHKRNPEGSINHQELLWDKLNVETLTDSHTLDAGLLDYTRLPVFMIETTPAEILRKLKRDDSGYQIKRLLKSLERLESTTMRFRINQPGYRFSFASNILSFTYKEPGHNTGTPSLRIAINHFSVQSLSNKRGGYTLHQVDEKVGMSELESAIHSQLCRVVTPGKATGIRFEKLYIDSYGVTSAKELTRFHRRRFKSSLDVVKNHLIDFGWKFRERDTTTLDAKRPTPPNPEKFINRDALQPE